MVLKPPFRVLNKSRHKIPENSVYVGRPSIWGNPFTIGRHGAREEVIAKYEAWFREQPDLMGMARRELRHKNLVCWCAPAACHADVILRIANETVADD